jgi:hypothetical protein
VSFEDMDPFNDIDYIMLFYLFNEQKYKLNTRVSNSLIVNKGWGNDITSFIGDGNEQYFKPFLDFLK